MEPQAAIDSFKNVYVREYRNSVADLYKEDVKNSAQKTNSLRGTITNTA